MDSTGLRLLYATLITASRSWKGVREHPDIWFDIELLRREAFGELNQWLKKSWWQCRMPSNESIQAGSFYRRMGI